MQNDVQDDVMRCAKIVVTFVQPALRLKTQGVENRRRFSTPCVFSLRPASEITYRLCRVSVELCPLTHSLTVTEFTNCYVYNSVSNGLLAFTYFQFFVVIRFLFLALCSKWLMMIIIIIIKTMKCKQTEQIKLRHHRYISICLAFISHKKCISEVR